CPERQSCQFVAGSFVCSEEHPLTDAALPVDGFAAFDAPDGGPPLWTLIQTVDSITNTTPMAATGSGHAIIVAFESPAAVIITAVTDNAPGGGNTYTRIAQSRSTNNGE